MTLSACSTTERGFPMPRSSARISILSGLSEYASCPLCGEYHTEALRRGGLCANCAGVDPSKDRGPCLVCGERDLPLQNHHVAGRRKSDITVPICLNCHSVLSRRQRHNEQDTEIRALLYGALDIALLWWERLDGEQKQACIQWLLDKFFGLISGPPTNVAIRLDKR